MMHGQQHLNFVDSSLLFPTRSYVLEEQNEIFSKPIYIP